MIGKLNHVAIVVPDLAAASALYRDTLGSEVLPPHELPEHGVTAVFVELGNTRIELLEPLVGSVALALTLRSCRPSSPSTPGRAVRGRRVLDRVIAVLPDPVPSLPGPRSTTLTNNNSAPALIVMTQLRAVFGTTDTRRSCRGSATAGKRAGRPWHPKATPAPWQAGVAYF